MKQEKDFQIWKAAVKTTRENIVKRLDETVCENNECVDPFCSAIRTAIGIIEGKYDYPDTNECLYCDEVYDIKDYDTCPSCAVNTDTKGITVIVLDKEEE
jgi:hypothetical protein